MGTDQVVHRCYYTRGLGDEIKQVMYCGAVVDDAPDYSDRREMTCPKCIEEAREAGIIATYGSLGS